jgi:hypothetical protein
MRRTRALWEVFVRRFEDAFERYRSRRLTGEEAGEVLGMSGRHFRRLCDRYEEDGIDGLRDRRIDKPSPRRAPASELEQPPEDRSKFKVPGRRLRVDRDLTPEEKPPRDRSQGGQFQVVLEDEVRR